MSTIRKAIVTNQSLPWGAKTPEDGVRLVQRYLPSNYTAAIEDDKIVFTGTDDAGWTMEGYVLPRLASGGIYATEVEPIEVEDEDDTSFVCHNCEETYDAENEGLHYSEASGDAFCDQCWYEQFNEASKAALVEDGEATQYLVTEHGVFLSEYLEEVEGTLVRTYHATDGWRGYYETKPVGEWREVASGWTTGNWGDSISDGKQAFNRWVEAVITGELVLDHPIWIIADLTSNVFSTAMGVYVPSNTEDPEIPSF